MAGACCSSSIPWGLFCGIVGVEPRGVGDVLAILTTFACATQDRCQIHSGARIPLRSISSRLLTSKASSKNRVVIRLALDLDL